MAHLPHFIVDLALILGVAGVTTLIFRRINQPVVLGYIIAGLLVGPHISLVPTVADEEGVRLWSEIGVIKQKIDDFLEQDGQDDYGTSVMWRV